jgi:hypothetical protein
MYCLKKEGLLPSQAHCSGEGKLGSVTKQYAIVAYGRASFHAFLTPALSKLYRSAQTPGTNSMGG